MKRFLAFLSLLFIWQFHPFNALGQIDLHNHLFMKKGIGWLLRGDFQDPLQAKNWADMLSSKSNRDSLLNSKAKIVVASLYTHPLLKWDQKQAIWDQIHQANEFIKSHSNWVLGLNPQQVERDLKRGKQILILSIEGASGILENEEDLNAFIDKGNVRIVTPLHFVDDEIGGAVFFKSLPFVFQPIAYFKSLFDPQKDSNGVRINKNGLSEKGKWLIKELMKRKVWIDFSHASDFSQYDMIEILKEKKFPLLYTHTIFRKFHGAERGISVEQLYWVKQYGGMVGIMPSSKYLDGAPPEKCSQNCKDCSPDIDRFISHYKEMEKIVGSHQLTIGTDFNAPLKHLAPPCENSPFKEKGFWSMGQFHDLHEYLRKRGVPLPKNNEIWERKFISLWKKMY